MADTHELREMLTYARPYQSAMESLFVNTFVAPLAPERDGFGNHFVRIGDAPILWSSHTDTVHRRPGRQVVALNRAGVARLVGGKAGDCLGADDAAGVWIMLEMIRARVPGLYVFHRGEERGGLGSGWIADRHPEFLTGLQAAVAFDRRGTRSVITHQAGERCCSNAFALALAAQIGMRYVPDDTGVFTDTANYMHNIPECTNLSVGYEREHGPTETLDMRHAATLRDAMCAFDPSDLPYERDPTAWDDKWAEWDASFVPRKPQRTLRSYDEDMIGLIEEYPEEIAELLRDAGFSANDLMRAIQRIRDEC